LYRPDWPLSGFAGASRHVFLEATTLADDPAPLRVLVAEDEALVAMLVEDMLTDIGCIVIGPAGSLDEALQLAREDNFDVALLDVNLAGRPVFPVADILRERGVPYVFASGYGESGVSDEHRGAPVLQKPFRESDLARILAEYKRA
jgi:CheY-like chemotaxis protein